MNLNAGYAMNVFASENDVLLTSQKDIQALDLPKHGSNI